MKGWNMYSRIHQLKENGFKKAQVAQKLGINVKTVSKYWELQPDEYYQKLVNSRQRPKYLEQYEDDILGWLTDHPDMSSAQIHDWLKEHHPDTYKGKERTVRYYVSSLRKKHCIPKNVPTRQHQAVEDPPMGEQAQVDFGEKILCRADGTTVKLYCMGVVLSHSRYKYGEWWDKPLTTAKLVELLNHAFEYFGGRPKNLVFDQDKIVAVSENYGDVIFTHEFERYRQQMKFKVHLCRGADPQSKGRVEAVVKYLKNSFAAHRTYTNLAALNEDCLAWLSRTGNATIHGITKKIPAQVFLLEKQYLQPVSPTINSVTILTRGVRKDNTILYLSNRYSVPLGTYRPGKQLFLTIEADTIVLTDPANNQVIATHKINSGKGQLIQNKNHLRDNSSKISGLQAHIQDLLGDSAEASILLDMIRKEKPRYARDQFLLIRDVTRNYAMNYIQEAINYCVNNELWSAVEFRAATEHFSKMKVDSPLATSVGPASVPASYKIKPESRDIRDYVAICGGVKQ